MCLQKVDSQYYREKYIPSHNKLHLKCVFVNSNRYERLA